MNAPSPDLRQPIHDYRGALAFDGPSIVQPKHTLPTCPGKHLAFMQTLSCWGDPIRSIYTPCLRKRASDVLSESDPSSMQDDPSFPLQPVQPQGWQAACPAGGRASSRPCPKRAPCLQNGQIFISPSSKWKPRQLCLMNAIVKNVR